MADGIRRAQVQIAPCADPSAGALYGFIVGLINPKGPDGQVVAPTWRPTTATPIPSCAAAR
jgi:hypothetical protein